jgi:hypothetical protein
MFLRNICWLSSDYRVILQKIELFNKNENLTLCWRTWFSALVFSLLVLKPHVKVTRVLCRGGGGFTRELENGVGNVAHRDHRAWACGLENLGCVSNWAACSRPPAVGRTAHNFRCVSSYSGPCVNLHPVQLGKCCLNTENFIDKRGPLSLVRITEELLE